MLYASLQGLQAATRQLLFHDGQRKLPDFSSALPVLLFSLSHRPTSIRGPLYAHRRPSAEQRLLLVSQLQQCPQPGHVLHSSFRQVHSEITSSSRK